MSDDFCIYRDSNHYENALWYLAFRKSYFLKILGSFNLHECEETFGILNRL